MQEIKAYVREERLDQVIAAPAAFPGPPGIAVVHLRDFGHAADDGRLVKTEMARLEFDVPDSVSESARQTIVDRGRTGEGHPEGGKVFVSDLQRAVRIADGAEGAAILQL